MWLNWVKVKTKLINKFWDQNKIYKYYNKKNIKKINNINSRIKIIKVVGKNLLLEYKMNIK